MKRCMLVLMLLVVVNFYSACTEKQMQQVDKIAEQGKEFTEQGEAVLESPIGELIPEPIKAGIRLGGEIFLILASSWLAWRAKKNGTALEEVVAGNETVKDKIDATGLESFKLAQAAAQTISTTKMVAAIRKKLKT